jgi:hypothetical protein
MSKLAKVHAIVAVSVQLCKLFPDVLLRINAERHWPEEHKMI